MTMPYERTRALLWAAEFMRDVCKFSPEELRNQASTILRHYPSADEIGQLHENEFAQRGPFSQTLLCDVVNGKSVRQ